MASLERTQMYKLPPTHTTTQFNPQVPFSTASHFVYLSLSLLCLLTLLSCLHLGPRRTSSLSNGDVTAGKAASTVKHQPAPRRRIMTSTTAVPSAPKLQRTRLLAAGALAGASGCWSSSSTPSTVKKPLIQNPIRNWSASGTATCTLRCSDQP